MRHAGYALLLAGMLVPVTPSVASANNAVVDWAGLADTGGQSATAKVNANLLGKQIELAGYLLPVDREGDNVHSFLLVPISGACSHMPTPPANQIVLVTLPRPFLASEIYQPVKVSGKLMEEHNMSQLFILDGIKVVDSAYSVGTASVSDWKDAPPAVGLGNPMLNKRAAHGQNGLQP